MIVNPDLHHQYALERLQRLREEAAAHRLADQASTRTRMARFLRRTGDRIDAATDASGQVCDALPERA